MQISGGCLLTKPCRAQCAPPLNTGSCKVTPGPRRVLKLSILSYLQMVPIAAMGAEANLSCACCFAWSDAPCVPQRSALTLSTTAGGSAEAASCIWMLCRASYRPGCRVSTRAPQTSGGCFMTKPCQSQCAPSQHYSKDFAEGPTAGIHKSCGQMSRILVFGPLILCV